VLVVGGALAHGVSFTITSAPFDAAVPEMRSKPDTLTTDSTPGTARTILRPARSTATVRS
jgi:hypothetical protein